MYADREGQKSPIFKRLTKTTPPPSIAIEIDSDDGEIRGDDSPVTMRITGMDNITYALNSAGSPSAGSIFSRLGGKTSDDVVVKQIKPILKNSASKVSSAAETKESLSEDKNEIFYFLSSRLLAALSRPKP